MADLVEYDLKENPRLRRSQVFNDPDYPTCVLKFLKDIYKRNPEDAKFVISRAARDGDEQDALDPQFKAAFETLGILPKSRTSIPPLPPIMIAKYLDITSFPDDFYQELADQINACYQYKLYSASQILIRKMLENCLIDILRKRYGMTGVKLFYDTARGRFRDFSILLETAHNKIKDFVHVQDSFNEELVKQINSFREQANSSAHNINLDAERVGSKLDTNRNRLNFVIKSLFRTINNM